MFLCRHRRRKHDVHRVNRRIEALDGLRAIAIGLVLLDHAIPSMNLKHAGQLAFIFLGNADLGVEIFFVLSGFLITCLLIKEHTTTGTLDLAAFYRRRARRILPAFGLWLGTITVLSLLGRIHVTPAEIVGTLLFIRMYVPGAGSFSWWTANAWTLNIEEWFYAGFPALFLFLTRRRVIACLALLVLVEPVARAIEFHLGVEGRIFAQQIHLRLDSIAVGCLLGFAVQYRRVQRWFESRQADAVVVVAVALIFVIVPALDAKLHEYFRFDFGYSLDAVGAAVLVGYIALRQNGILAKTLSQRTVVWFGVLSYSLYLWQQLFLTHFDIINWPLNLGCAFACACLSYYAVERPILAIGKRPNISLSPSR